jgi:ferredoxin
MESPFAVLGLDPEADESEIRQAYRERVKEAHPDHGGSAEEFRAVRTAYERLKDGSWEENGAQDAGERSGERPKNGRSRSDRTRPGPTSNGTHERAEPRERQARQSHSEVAYLNYDVLTDYGWQTTDADLFEKAAAADLDVTDYGEFRAERDESLLEAAEDEGFAWPFACRGGACANCAIVLYEGELSMPGDHVLPSEMMERDVRLSCNGKPVTDEVKVIYNVKHMPELEDLLLPPQPFEQAYPGEL